MSTRSSFACRTIVDLFKEGFEVALFLIQFDGLVVPLTYEIDRQAVLVKKGVCYAKVY